LAIKSYMLYLITYLYINMVTSAANTVQEGNSKKDGESYNQQQWVSMQYTLLDVGEKISTATLFQSNNTHQFKHYQTDNFTLAESSNKLGYMATLRLRDGIISEL
jgi:hypothetical protein